MLLLRHLKNISCSLLKPQFNYELRRRLHKTTNLKVPGAYEASGKTTVHVLNKDTELGIMIDGYSEVGFRLNNGFTVIGSMVIFPRSVLSWNVEDVSEVNEDSLSLFTVLEPKIDILVIGVGDPLTSSDFYKKVVPLSKKYKINLEVLPTDQACTTFNFLNSEGRHVAGALIPPKTINFTEDDELKSKMRYQNLYERE